jgi:hypothetical protein
MCVTGKYCSIRLTDEFEQINKVSVFRCQGYLRHPGEGRDPGLADDFGLRPSPE